jgi:hypothetical protein
MDSVGVCEALVDIEDVEGVDDILSADLPPFLLGLGNNIDKSNFAGFLRESFSLDK